MLLYNPRIESAIRELHNSIILHITKHLTGWQFKHLVTQNHMRTIGDVMLINMHDDLRGC